MQIRTLRNLFGIFVAAALMLGYATLILTRAKPPAADAVMSVANVTQMLKIAQTEKFQSDMQFAASNAEAARLVGRKVRLGRIEGGDPVVELNVREGGVIEYLLDKKGSDGKPQRVIYLPVVGDPVGSRQLEWKCYSANWSGVTRLWGNCTYDATAWDIERRHVANLRSAAEKLESDAESARAKNEADRIRNEFERQRAMSMREADRAREEEENELARIERETERARIENERQKRGW